MNGRLLFVLAIVLIVITFTCVMLFLLVYRPWLRARGHALPVSLFSLLAMRLRGDAPDLLVDAWIELHQDGIQTAIRDVESAYQAHRSHIAHSHELAELVRRGSASEPK